ncbi:MAG: hypothetical protein ACR2FY_03140 [Pirellulaceae bacterium]
MVETSIPAAPLSPEAAPKEPVLATVISPGPSPWQFGLRALLGLMAVCCVQFALMSYLTVAGGFAVSLGVCVVAFVVMMAVATSLIGRRSPLLEKLDFYAIRLVLVMSVLFLGTLFAGGGTAAWYVASEMQLALKLETDLGLRSRSIQVYDSKGRRNALYIMTVSSGGIADRAGIRKGEVIYFDETQSAFYHRLADNRGKPVDINVAIGAASSSLDSCPKRAVTITLPP